MALRLLVIALSCMGCLIPRSSLWSLDEGPFIIGQWRQELLVLDRGIPPPEDAGKKYKTFHNPQADVAVQSLLQLQRRLAQLRQAPATKEMAKAREDLQSLLDHQMVSLAAYRGNWQIVSDGFAANKNRIRPIDIGNAIANLQPSWQEWRQAWRQGVDQLPYFIDLLRYLDDEPNWRLQPGKAWVEHGPVQRRHRTPQPVEFALGRSVPPTGILVHWYVEQQPSSKSPEQEALWTADGFPGFVRLETDQLASVSDSAALLVTGLLVDWDPWVIEPYSWRAALDDNAEQVAPAGIQLASSGIMTVSQGFVAGIPFGSATNKAQAKVHIIKTPDGTWQQILDRDVIFVLTGPQAEMAE